MIYFWHRNNRDRVYVRGGEVAKEHEQWTPHRVVAQVKVEYVSDAPRV